MFEPNAALPPVDGLSDNGCAIFAPPGRGMSHNRRTLQDVEAHLAVSWSANSRERERRTGVRMVAVVSRSMRRKCGYAWVGACACVGSAEFAARRSSRLDAGRTADRWRLAAVRSAGLADLVGARLRADAGGRRPVRDVGGRGQVRVSSTVPVARVPGAVLVRRAGRRWRRRCWWRSRSPCWSASRSTSCCGSWAPRTCQRRGCGVRRGHPGRPAGDGVDRGGCRRHRDVRGPGLANDPRRDRRDGGAGHQPGAAVGDARGCWRPGWWRCC